MSLKEIKYDDAYYFALPCPIEEGSWIVIGKGGTREDALTASIHNLANSYLEFRTRFLNVHKYLRKKFMEDEEVLNDEVQPKRVDTHYEDEDGKSKFSTFVEHEDEILPLSDTIGFSR